MNSDLRRPPRARIALAMLTILAAAAAAPAPPVLAAREPIPDRIGWLGIASLECDGTLRLDSDGRERAWRFRSEPRILVVAEDGPARGRLQAGDVIVAIDGRLITTRRAGRQFADPEPGEPVTLTVRRGRRELDVVIVPEALADGDPRAWPPPAPPAPGVRAVAPAPAAGPAPAALPSPPSPAAATSPPAPSTAPSPAAAPAAPPPPPPFNEAWFGFGFRCGPCTVRREEDNSAWTWDFADLPEVYGVEPGSPAAAAGLQRGDVLTRIDSVPLDSEEGGRRFGTVREGQRVRWTVRRGGRALELAMVAVKSPRPAPAPEPAAHPSAPSPPSPPSPPPQPQHLRYAGILDGVDVEVRSAGPVVVREDEASGRIVILVGTTVITLQESAAGAERAGRRE